MTTNHSPILYHHGDEGVPEGGQVAQSHGKSRIAASSYSHLLTETRTYEAARDSLLHTSRNAGTLPQPTMLHIPLPRTLSPVLLRIQSS